MEKMTKVSRPAPLAPEQWQVEALRWIAAWQKVTEGQYDKWLTEQGMSPIPEELKAQMKIWGEEHLKLVNEVVEATETGLRTI